jgi:hypothetical protein
VLIRKDDLVADAIATEAFTMDTFEYMNVERELSRKRKLAEWTTADEMVTANSSSHGLEEESEAVVWLYLKIRDKTGQDEKMRVRQVIWATCRVLC